MRLSAEQARARFARARVARLATITADGRPHLVPVTFAVSTETIFFAVDDKPKTTRDLHRLANLSVNAAVCLLVDHYDDDWTQLWWARADGTAAVHDERDARPALDLLAARYPAYAVARPPGPVVAVSVARWSGWSYAEIAE